MAISRRKKQKATDPLDAALDRVLSPFARKRGFAAAEILTQWPAIAGPDFADVSAPEKIHWDRTPDDEFKPGTLVVGTSGAHALFLQHQSAQIIQRVNSFFGFPAVDRLKIIQKPVRSAPVQEKPDRVPGHVDESEVAEIEEPGLRDALKRLGEAVRSKPVTKP